MTRAGAAGWRPIAAGDDDERGRPAGLPRSFFIRLGCRPVRASRQTAARPSSSLLPAAT